jgi:hypothetical protein
MIISVALNWFKYIYIYIYIYKEKNPLSESKKIILFNF